jgi:DTW domain-containing protein
VYHKTPLVILQDKKEAKHPFNTAIIAKLALEDCRITTDLSFPSSILDNYPNKRPLLLFPSIDLSGSAAYEKNKPIVQSAPSSDFIQYFSPANRQLATKIRCSEQIEDSDFVLIVIDATWRKAKRIYLEHVWLQKLQKLDISPQQRSAYQIRNAKQEAFLSTIESIGYALSYLEKNFNQKALLKPFEKMVQMHLR